MNGTAVVLAGLPGPAFNESLALLKRTFPVGYVIRGAAAKVIPRGRANYGKHQIAEIFKAAADAVFGHSRRSFSFCRNPQRPCAAAKPTGKTCGLETQQTCALAAPRKLILLYQQGDGEEGLIRSFYHSPLHGRIPQDIYNDRKRTAQLCVDQVRTLSAKADAIEIAMRNRNSPLLLPPKNFGEDSAVARLLEMINACADVTRSCQTFRRTHFKRDSHRFAGGRELGFKPAEHGEQHGKAGKEEPIERVLAKTFRLGCWYDNSRHWDVEPLDGKGLHGRMAVTCREYGRRFPKSAHVNIWPDDWLGP